MLSANTAGRHVFRDETFWGGGLNSHKLVPHYGSNDQRQARDYRADIDGLRALAVLPIVAFHLGLRHIGGGYVGVDIFFVISGYLIGGLVLKQVGAGRYSVLEFYFRRIRRIVPALAFSLFATTIAVALISLPAATADYGRSLVSTALFGSNFYFWSTDGYFSAASDAKPLLHTWSLAVEEQFYVLFPLIILALRPFGRQAILAGIAAIAIASLFLSVTMLPSSPAATFYLLPMRLWELLLGVLAVSVPAGRFAKARWREAASWTGLALILGPIFLYQPETPFPGLAAVPPCFGTALLLAAGAGGRSCIARMLSLPPVVFFGLISYSLYLWHWPVIVLMKQQMPLASLSFPLKVVAFALSTALGWLSWRFIERPWRNPAVQKKTVMRATIASGTVLGALGLAFSLSQGFPNRYDPQVLRIAALEGVSASNDFRNGTCFISSAYRFADFDRRACLAFDPGRPDVLLMGDSHAAHLWTGLQRRFPDLHFQQATASGCTAVLNRPIGIASRCDQMMRFLFDSYLPSRAGSWVILAGSWGASDSQGVGQTLDWLRSKNLKVILVGPIVKYDLPLPRLMALAEARHDRGLVERFRDKDGAKLDMLYAQIAAKHGALYMSPYQALCGARSCQTADATGLPLQFDYGHVTAAGSLLVAGQFPKKAVLAQ